MTADMFTKDFIKKIKEDPFYREGLQEGLEKGLEKGLQEGREEASVITICNMLEEGFEAPFISKVTFQDLSKVELIREQLKQRARIEELLRGGKSDFNSIAKEVGVHRGVVEFVRLSMGLNERLV